MRITPYFCINNDNKYLIRPDLALKKQAINILHERLNIVFKFAYNPKWTIFKDICGAHFYG